MVTSGTFEITRHPVDARAKPCQFFLDMIVTAIDVINPRRPCLTVGDQASQDQAGGGTQVGCHDLGTIEIIDTVDNRGIAFDVHGGTQPQISWMCMKRFRIRFRSPNRCRGDRIKRTELRLHIGRKPG